MFLIIIMFSMFSATQEMLSILQENGEVVCVMGSSANLHNTGVFLQANAR